METGMSTEQIETRRAEVLRQRQEAERAEQQRRNAEEQYKRQIASADEQLVMLEQRLVTQRLTDAVQVNQQLIGAVVDTERQIVTVLADIERQFVERVLPLYNRAREQWIAQQNHVESAVANFMGYRLNSSEHVNSMQNLDERVDAAVSAQSQLQVTFAQFGNAPIPWTVAVQWINSAETPEARQARAGLVFALKRGDWDPQPDYDAQRVTDERVRAARQPR